VSIAFCSSVYRPYAVLFNVFFYIVNIYRNAENIMVYCMVVIFAKEKRSLEVKQCIAVCVNISVSAVIDCQSQ
jgi:hypothetical protein